MEDYNEDKAESYRQIRRKIQSLQSRLRASRDSFQKHDLIERIGKLEQERLKEENLFVPSEGEAAEDAAPEDELPILNSIWSTYESLVSDMGEQNRDVLGLLLYLRYFAEEFLGFFSPRKLRLDVKYSMVRDTFYNMYSQLDRSVGNYRAESNRIADGDYAKKYEEEIFRRLVEMRHGVFIEADKFFRRVRQFADDLLADLEGNRILCQNGDDILSYGTIDRETVLRGVTVSEALVKLYELADEAILFLDVPDFNK